MPQRESFRRAARLSRGRGEGERLHHYAAVGYGRWLVKCLSVNLSGAPLVSHAGGGRGFSVFRADAIGGGFVAGGAEPRNRVELPVGGGMVGSARRSVVACAGVRG